MKRVPTQRGVTFVELLVTIVLVGIFFAAIVPVFVLASRSSAVDRARVNAMNVAQSRIEAIRSMAYERILDDDDANPDSLPTLSEIEAAMPDDELFDIRFSGPWKTDADAKAYQVTYAVDTMAGATASDPQQYKVVAVTVTWDGPPETGKPVVLRTAIYRQASGPEATGLRIYTDVQQYGSQTFWTEPIKATLTISKVDAALVDYVRFVVYANNGSQIATGTVSNAAADSPAFPIEQYNWTWEESVDAPDGAYTFAAVAVEVDSEQTGNIWQKPFYIDHQPPDAPQWAPGFPIVGAKAIIVGWQAPTAGDVSYYEVQRRVAGSATTDADFTDLPRWSTTLIDRKGLTPGQAYEYRVRAVDESGQIGAWTETWSTQAVPGDVSGAAPAAPPAPVGAEQLVANAGDDTSRQRQVTVRWTASPDDVVTTGTVKYYAVYRSQIEPATSFVDQGTGWSSPITVKPVSQPEPDYETPDASVDWRGIYQYSVTSLDAALNESARTQSPSVTVLLPTGDFYLSVYAAADPDLLGKAKWYARFSIVSLDTGDVYPQPWGITQINDKTWVNGSKPYVQQLSVFGRYQVVATFFTQTGVYMGTNSGFIDLAEGREVTVTYEAPSGGG